MSATANTTDRVGGYTDSRGEWRPENPVEYAPLFTWPPRVKQFLIWLVNYLFTWNLFYLSIVLLSFYFLQPPLEKMKTLKVSWIAILLIRNMALVWIIYGGWHLFLYVLKRRGTRGKYNPRWQSTDGSVFLWNNQVYDNVFWACASGVPIWTAYEVLAFWLYANNKLPYLSFYENPGWFIGLFLLIPFWRELHFFLIHRLIHWKPLYKRIHYLHHYNINPGPWSGLAMHPVEHLLYFSVMLIHFIIPSHPIHFLFNSQHTALTPAPGHTGFEGKLGRFLSFGSYFHYLHHRLFECNYGESTIPLDKWFGVFENGAQTQSEKQQAISRYHKLRVTRIIDETPEVKSIYLTGVEETPPGHPIPGQHLTFRFPFKGDKLHLSPSEKGDPVSFALRSYTISDIAGDNKFRVSIKKEKNGKVSQAIHQDLKTGDILEARGPKGNFIYTEHRKKTDVFIAGGIGVTPIIAILKSNAEKKQPVYLILAIRETRLLTFRDEILELCKLNPQIKVHVFVSQKEKADDILPDGWDFHFNRMTLESLKNILPSKNPCNIYYCGPEGMTTTLLPEIRDWKGKRTPIQTEKFGIQQTHSSIPSESKSALVQFTRSGASIEWDPEQRNLLEFAESNGISMEAGCMFGECGACSVKLLDGEVTYNYDTATQPSKGNCLPCSCYPASDIQLDC